MVIISSIEHAALTFSSMSTPTSVLLLLAHGSHLTVGSLRQTQFSSINTVLQIYRVLCFVGAAGSKQNFTLTWSPDDVTFGSPVNVSFTTTPCKWPQRYVPLMLRATIISRWAESVENIFCSHTRTHHAHTRTHARVHARPHARTPARTHAHTQAHALTLAQTHARTIVRIYITSWLPGFARAPPSPCHSSRPSTLHPSDYPASPRIFAV